MKNNSFGKFDIHPGCEEADGFVPSRSDLAAMLGEDEITALYAQPVAPSLASDLFAIFSAPAFAPLS